MPYKSKAQMRYFFAAEKEGKLPKGTARRWAHETKDSGKDLKKLPDHKDTEKTASISELLLKLACQEKLAATGVNTATRMAMPRKASNLKTSHKIVAGRTPIVGTAKQLSESMKEKLKNTGSLNTG